ncbi:MAG: hypothetical protein ACKOYN_11680, partial [Planctomycetota bacterium]
VADTTPGAARAAVDGLVYEGLVADAELPAFAAEHRVISAVLNEGRSNRVRVFVGPGREMPAGFSRSAATLEDAYLVLMRCPADEVPQALALTAREPAGGGVHAGGAA